MSHRRPDPKAPARAARADSLETSEGTLIFAKVAGLEITRDRGGRVLMKIGADPRGSVLLEPEAVARLYHALGCSIWPYGEKPKREES